jgi:hypothetical protein
MFKKIKTVLNEIKNNKVNNASVTKNENDRFLTIYYSRHTFTIEHFVNEETGDLLICAAMYKKQGSNRFFYKNMIENIVLTEEQFNEIISKF